jgi:hypothetical protein
MSDQANAERGETELMLDGRVFVLRPSFTAINAFENATGKAVMELAADASVRKMKASDAAEVVTACIKAQGEATNDGLLKGVNAKRIGELIMESTGGLVMTQIQLATVLFNAATGGYTAKGEPRAAAGPGTATDQPAAA